MSLRKRVTQDDLRKAMSEAKKKVAKKIVSPLAKYTETGQLKCILCKKIVHSETVWPVHLNSKGHKEKIIMAKKIVSELDNSNQIAASATKRPSSPSVESNAVKRTKGILKNAGSTKLPSNLPADFFDGAFKQPNPVGASVASKTSEKSEIPRAEKAKEGGSREAQESNDEANSASLPEGFFDDPRMDAKARQVDYKDPMEEEWDKFQKVIKEETAQSAQIIADDQEEATTERQIDEMEEQMRNWSRVMELVRRKEQTSKQASEKKMDTAGEDASSDEDEEYDEFLDWRAKNSYRQSFNV